MNTVKTRNEALEKENRELKERVATLEVENERWKLELVAANSALKLAQGELAANRQIFQQEKDRLAVQKNDLQRKMKEYEDEVTQASKSLQAAEHQVSDLQSEITRLSNKAQRSNREKERLKALEQELVNRKRDVASLTTKKNEVEEQRKEAQKRLDESRSSLVQAEEKLRDAQSKIDAMGSRIKDFDEFVETIVNAGVIFVCVCIAMVLLVLIKGVYDKNAKIRRMTSSLGDREKEAQQMEPAQEMRYDAIVEYCSQQAIISELRIVAIVVGLLALVGIVIGVWQFYELVTTPGGDSDVATSNTMKELKEFAEGTLWKIIAGFSAPAVAVAAVYTSLQGRLMQTIKTCAEIGLIKHAPSAEERALERE